MEFKSIRIRLSFWFFLVALIPLTTVISVIYVDRVESIKTEAFDKLIAIRDLRVSQVKNWIEERRGDINLLAMEPEVKRIGDIMGAKEFNRRDFIGFTAEVRKAFNARIISYEDYSEIFFISSQTGKVVVSSQEASEGEDKSENTYFTTPLQTRDIFIKDIYFSKVMDAPTLTFSIPVFSSVNQDEVTGIVVARVDLSQSLYALLMERTGMGNTGETLIVNKDAVALNELRWYKNAPLNLKITAKPAVYASRGRSGIIESEDYHGKMVLAAYTYIPAPGWGFVTKQYLDEIYRPVRVFLNNCLIIFVVSAVGVYLVSLIIARGIAAPLKQLVAVSEKVIKGDLSARSSIRRLDEVGVLSSALDNMTSTLDLRAKALANIAEIMTTVVEAEGITNYSKLVLQKIMNLTSSEIGSCYMLEHDTDRFVPITSFGISKDFLEPIDSTKLEGQIGRGIEPGKINHIKDIPVDMFRGFKILNGDAVQKELITISLRVKRKTECVFFLGTTDCYDPEHLYVINSSLSTLATGLASLVAIEITRRLALNLTEANRELGLSERHLQLKSDDFEKQNVDLIAQRILIEERSNELKVRVDESEQLNKAMVNLLEDLQDNQKQLKVTSQQLAYSNKELEGFSYSVSHDLRAPLRHMSGFTSLLEKHADAAFDDKSRHYVNIIKSSSKKMGQLIDDLLQYSRTGRTKMRKHKINNEELVQGVIKELEAYEKGRHIDWIIGQLPSVLADQPLLRVIWVNLLGNAVKFTGNKEKAKIEIGSRIGEQDEIVYYVRDNGAGFDMKYQDKLFGVFQRLHRDSEFEGTGIGLATIQRIIHRHGGHIWAEGAIDEGATFFFAFPKEV